MEQEQWLQLEKMLFLLGSNLKIVIWWGWEGGGGGAVNKNLAEKQFF